MYDVFFDTVSHETNVVSHHSAYHGTRIIYLNQSCTPCTPCVLCNHKVMHAHLHTRTHAQPHTRATLPKSSWDTGHMGHGYTRVNHHRVREQHGSLVHGCICGGL